MVGDPQRVEASLLGAPGLLDQVARPELLTREKHPIFMVRSYPPGADAHAFLG